MAPPKDIARSYPKRGITADVGFRSEPKFCGDGSTDFDGTADKVTAAHYNPSGDFLTTTVWFKADQIRNQGIVHNGDSGRNAFLFYMGATNNIQFYWNDTAGDALITHQSSLIAGQWHHLAMVLDMSDPSDHQATCYIDGVAATGSRTSASWVGDNTYQFGNQYVSAGWFDGKIANGRIYNAALTQDQIHELYNNPGLDFPSGLAASNLRRHYKLETDFNDSGADSENATASGSPSFTVDRPQLPRGLDLVRGAAQARFHTGRAVDFDGSTDFLNMGFGANKNYTTRSDRASFSVWFNTDTTSAVGFLYQNRKQVDGTDRPECETHLFISPSTGLGFDGEGASVLIPVGNIKVGVWHHFVGVADDSDGPVKAYLDGVLYDTTSPIQAGANGDNFVIGARNNSPLQPFNGKLSNFKIFNVELTQNQVRELYHNPEMVIPTGVSASNLRRHYPLCANNDTSAFGGRYESDQGVEGVNGVYGGSPVMSFAEPVPCPQLALQQSATRIYFPANVANYADFTLGSALGSSFTYAAWLQPVNNNLQGFYCLFTSGASDQFSAYMLSAGTIQAGNTSSVTTTETVTLGDWNHIVITGDSSSPHAKIYINGSAATLSGTIDSAGMTETGIRLGMRGASSTANRQAHCIFAESAFWDVNLSASEVTTLYNSGVMGYDTSSVQSSQLKAWHKYDDFATLKDFSGEGRDATVSGTFTAVQFPENASGSTLVGDISMKRKGASVLNCFDDPGAESVRTEIPSGAGLMPSLTNGHTVSCWHRNQMQNTTSANNGTMVLGGDDSGNHRFFLEVFNGNKFRGCYGTQTASSTTAISDNEWHHYAMVLDVTTASPTVRLYLDGVAVNTASGSLGTTFPDGPVIVGGLTTTTTRRLFDYALKGPIACPRIYAFQLSENEIKQIYHADERLIKGLNNE